MHRQNPINCSLHSLKYIDPFPLIPPHDLPPFIHNNPHPFHPSNTIGGRERRRRITRRWRRRSMYLPLGQMGNRSALVEL